MIDPTCGSGHFLLGGFARLFDLWSQRESNEIKAAQKALDGVWGVDINPFAVAIARFRLIVAAVQACGIKRLKEAPGWKIHLATGDSLLWGSRWNADGTKRSEARYLDESWGPDLYACEDKEGLQQILGQQYHAVVGNPPYIPAHDKTLNKLYRARYPSCSGKYSLCVPFIERFFELANSSLHSGRAGYMGSIVSSSFAKNQFGKSLVQRYLPKLDLTHVLDTSDAYIPGHNTATLILFGRNRRPVMDSVRCVLGIRGEKGVPPAPATAKVWTSILSTLDSPNTTTDFISVNDLQRSLLSKHPWTLRGGGISQLKEKIDNAGTSKLRESAHEIGVLGMTNADEVFLCSGDTLSRFGVEVALTRVVQPGESARDRTLLPGSHCIFPYLTGKLIDITHFGGAFKRLWPFRTTLGNRATFDGGTYFSSGIAWWKWHQIAHQRLKTAETILFAEIATGNHFVYVDHACVFNQTGPIIKLNEKATRQDFCGLIAVLNSSTSCLWMKETCRPKGGDNVGKEGGRVRKTPWDERYAFSSNPIKSFPIPANCPAKLGEKLCKVGKDIGDVLRRVDAASSAGALEELRQECEMRRRKAIFLQEELDWHCYFIYGLLPDDRCYKGDGISELVLGERPFEIVMARRMAKGELESTWFKRHGSTPITECPVHWPSDYRKLIEDRIKLIEANNEISLLERPEYKRRWNAESWEGLVKRALKKRLLDRLENTNFREGANPILISTARMADVASGDAEFLQLGTLYRRRPDFNVASLVAELVEGESVPILPILRYKPTGLRKRQLWERTWDLQRQQDAGTGVREIPPPPEFRKDDFAGDQCWGLRGKLDVPKEALGELPALFHRERPDAGGGLGGVESP